MHALLPRRAEAVGLLHDGDLREQDPDIPERQQQQARDRLRQVQLPKGAADLLDRRGGHEQKRRKQAEHALHHQRQH